MSTKKTVKEKLSGVLAPMCTPFKANDDIDFDALAGNVKKMNDSGLHGYFSLGTNGEYKSLSQQERLKVLETVVKNASSDIVITAGAGEESTRSTIEMARLVADIGAELISLLMPSFFAKRMTDDVQVSYVLDVADASPVPVVIYNNPSVAAGVTVRRTVLDRISGHPNVVGVKDSSKETYKENLGAGTDSFFIMAGSAGYYLDLLKSGGTGGVLSLANVIPAACAQLYELFVAGKIEEADKLNERLVTLNKQISGTYGVAGVKAAMDVAGLVGGNPRKPLPGVSEEDRGKIKQIMEESGFLS